MTALLPGITNDMVRDASLRPKCCVTIAANYAHFLHGIYKIPVELEVERVCGKSAWSIETATGLGICLDCQDYTGWHDTNKVMVPIPRCHCNMVAWNEKWSLEKCACRGHNGSRPLTCLCHMTSPDVFHRNAYKHREVLDCPRNLPGRSFVYADRKLVHVSPGVWRLEVLRPCERCGENILLSTFHNLDECNLQITRQVMYA